jgi:hypothetical protein
MLLTVIALSLGTFIGFKKLQPKSEPRQPTNESTTVTTTQSTATQTKKSQSRAAAQKNGSLPTESSGTASTATDSGSAAPYPGDSCIDYDAGSLYVAPHSPGYVIKNDIVTIPITFESETKALALLRESRAHTGLCTEPNLNDDLSRGFDTFVVWKGSASDSSLNNLILPFPSCSFPPALTFEREYEQGPFYLADNGKAVLKFDSASKATRALTLFNSAMGGLIFSGELCTIGISDSQEVGSEKHPVIAYKEH